MQNTRINAAVDRIKIVRGPRGGLYKEYVTVWQGYADCLAHAEEQHITSMGQDKWADNFAWGEYNRNFRVRWID